jgi:hypothetical protein
LKGPVKEKFSVNFCGASTEMQRAMIDRADKVGRCKPRANSWATSKQNGIQVRKRRKNPCDFGIEFLNRGVEVKILNQYGSVK